PTFVAAAFHVQLELVFFLGNGCGPVACQRALGARLRACNPNEQREACEQRHRDEEAVVNSPWHYRPPGNSRFHFRSVITDEQWFVAGMFATDYADKILFIDSRSWRKLI